jgi:tRNA(Leu) C34 or U34 (ribose-2'-O)-methylase TrmL
MLIIGLTNPKSPENVGSAMRAAGCFSVDSVFYTGNRYDQAKKYNTDTNNANQHIPLVHVENLIDNIPENVEIVCVELVEGAMPLPKFEHPKNAMYIFGPEDGNLDKKTVQKARAVVYVPTIGCMNLAATVNVLLYDRMAKSDLSFASDELIRQSRDTNNRLKVRKQN